MGGYIVLIKFGDARITIRMMCILLKFGNISIVNI